MWSPNSPTNDVTGPASIGLLLLGWVGPDIEKDKQR